jgi:hypothetical protein
LKTIPILVARAGISNAPDPVRGVISQNKWYAILKDLKSKKDIFDYSKRFIFSASSTVNIPVSQDLGKILKLKAPN